MDERKDLHSTNTQEQKFRKVKLGALKLVSAIAKEKMFQNDITG